MDLQKFKRCKKVYYTGVAILVIIILSIFLSLLIPVDNSTVYMSVALTAFPLCIISLVLILIGALLTNKYRALDVKGVLKNATYYTPLPYYNIEDYKAELDSIRKNYYADLSENRNTVDVDKIEKDFINKKVKEPIRQFLNLDVLKSGKIYYGYVVSCYNLIDTLANNQNKFGIIKILYSPEEYFETNPDNFKEICKGLCNYESDVISAEKLISEPFISNFKLPAEVCDGREVYITSVFVERRQLPTGHISNKILPVIASPKKTESAFVVDCKYWSDAFVGNFAYVNDAIKYPEYNAKRISQFSEKRCNDYLKELNDIREKFTADEINAPVDLLGDNPFPSFEFANLKIYYSYILDSAVKKSEGEPYVGIYSGDEYFKVNPKQLKTIAEKLLKDENASKNIKNVVNYKKHIINTFTLPRDITNGRQVIMTAVFIEKEKLPLKRINNNMLPVLSFGGEDEWIYMADCKYWSDGFTYEYVYAD